MVNQLAVPELIGLSLGSLLIGIIAYLIKDKIDGKKDSVSSIRSLETSEKSLETSEKSLKNCQKEWQQAPWKLKPEMTLNTNVKKQLKQEQQMRRMNIQPSHQELKRVNPHFQNIFNQAKVAIALVNLQGKFVQVNQAFCDLIGYTSQELIKLQLSKITHPEERLSDSQWLNQLLKNSCEAFSREKRYVKKDGSIIWGQVTVSVMKDQAKKPQYFIVIINAISDRQETERHRDRFFVMSLDLLCIAGFDGYFKTLNPVFERILGYSSRELLAQPFIEFIHPDDRSTSLAELANLRQGKETIHFENRYRCRDGSYRWLSWTSAPYMEEKLIYAVARDITEEKKIEIALKDSEERFRQIVTTISDGLIVVNLEGNIRFVNLAAQELFVRSETELLEHPFGLPIVVDKITEICIQPSRNTLIVAEMRSAEITWEGEKGYLISLRNITDSYQANQKLAESEEKYRKIVETTNEGIWISDHHNKITFVNHQMSEILGYTVDKMMGMSLLTFIDAAQLSLVEKSGQKTEQSLPGTHDLKLRRQDGSELWAIVSTNALFNPEGDYMGTLGLITDITKRKRTEQALYDSEKRLEGILNSLQDVIWSADPKTRQSLYLNPAIQLVYGRPMEDFFRDPHLWLCMVHPEDQELVSHHLKLLEDKGSTEVHYRIIRPDGETRWLHSRSRLVYDEQGKSLRIDGINSDITERKQAEEQLQYNATHDTLTQLPNRLLFMDRLEHALERRRRYSDPLFAVLFLDLDEFKVINDSLGHALGDELLREIARRLQKSLRADDTLARLGGDEFTILLEEIHDVKDAIKIAERIHKDLTRPFNLEGQEIFTNTSIGIALSNGEYEAASEILRDADTAMYRAKAGGKACYAIFDQQMHASAVSRLQLETDLRRAIERQEFLVYYQPIISLQHDTLTGFEALIRWQHPQQGLVPPARFIPIAEETGLIVPIGEWILEQAAQQLKIWQTQYRNYESLKMSVNLSSKQLRDASLLGTIDRILSKTEIDNNALKVEITESILMENVQVAADVLIALRERNIEICLDDFGTGYSSLSYLHRFPVNTLKIDRSFVMRMRPNDENSEIVRAIVSLAHILGMEIIAEGIETELQLAQLKWIGCEQGQGYFFAKPLATSEVEALLKNPHYWANL
ncbi:diguanylate cyclase/phosphodiesterase with PAS/PAC sensor(s) [Rippkaea orientalis PCC 8801]|uniref:Diguanylate cyclase/phosphodiesterase with PAS/PAC sensor(S) n=1 Tax=Rippkaea orientalis (strain PCC 8801 / RF-1) TaxID=41431 RepID=B7JWK6_RIPO1|nr:PAS domain S-box protein [Rippkaea orientalis]ACK68347.1 diguanylate cyclase/phosphodiesterase with PAS/PAC sensor(s) [Rippkaea orientalis PCC 8801]